MTGRRAKIKPTDARKHSASVGGWNKPPKPDISIWQKTGHFYFALTYKTADATDAIILRGKIWLGR
jgi:hypothetical protein